MNDRGHYFIKDRLHEKYVFEYYLVTQISSDLDQEQIIEKKNEPIVDLETVVIWANMTNQYKELPAALTDFEKWVFPKGLSIIHDQHPKYPQLDDFFNNPASKLGSNVHEINYFVVTDFKTLEKYYCTCAFFYERVTMIDKDQEGHSFFIPRSHIIMSRVAFFNAQKNLIGFLLHVHRGKQNMEQDRVIHATRGEEVFGIEQSKLFEYYIQFAFERCVLSEENEHVQLKFHSSEKQLFYFTRNDISNTFVAIASPSNSFFDSLIFGQSPYNLFLLVYYMLLEYQIVLLSRRTNSLTLFAENLIELIKPLTWRGVYIPNLVSLSIFDYVKSKLPYIVGLHKDAFKASYNASHENNEKTAEQHNRVVFDIDEGTFLHIFEKKKIKPPIFARNYLLNKINIVIGDIKFFEEDYLNEAVLHYKQYFYNFILLTFHSMLNFFSKGGEDHSQPHTPKNSSKELIAQATTSASSHNFMKSLNGLSEQVQSNGAYSNSSFQTGGAKHSSKSPPKGDPFLSKKVVFFNYKAFAGSFDDAEEFYTHSSKTFIFNGLIKDCFRATDFKDEFLEVGRQRQYDYTFGAVIQFIEDGKRLNHGGRAIQEHGKIMEKLNEIEEIQQKTILKELTQNWWKERVINADEGVAEYLESFFQSSNNLNSNKKDSLERTATSLGIHSSYLSSFLNTQIDMHKEIIKTPTQQAIKARKVLSSISFTQTSTDFLKDDPHSPYVTKEQFHLQYLEDRKKRKDPRQSDLFNDDLWKIPSQSCEDIEEPNEHGHNNPSSKMNIQNLSLFDKKNMLSHYQKQDEGEEEIIRQFFKSDGLSTVIEVQSAYSGFPQRGNNPNRKNSFKEFVKANGEHMSQLPEKNADHKSSSSSTGANAGDILCSQASEESGGEVNN